MNSRNPGSAKAGAKPLEAEDNTIDFFIRQATPQDFAAIGAFLNPQASAGYGLRHPDIQVKLAEKSGANELHLLAVHQTKIIGRVRLRFKPGPHRSGELAIAVHRAYHRRGIGTALLHAAIDTVERDLLAERIELHVFADNLAAISLYEKFGFARQGRIENEIAGAVTPAACEATPRFLMVRQCCKEIEP